MTSTTQGRPPRCEHSEIEVVVETDKPDYGLGEDVVIMVRATNISRHDCEPFGMSHVRVFAGDDGSLVFDMPPTVVDYVSDARWEAGGVRRDEVRWDQSCTGNGCEDARVAPGDYTVEATWRLDYGPARRTIHIG